MLLLDEQSLLAVLHATFVHVAAVAGHEAIHIGAPSIVRAVPATLAVVALLGLALLTLSRWLRDRLSQRAFRCVHLLAYGAFLAAAGHAVLAGGSGVDARVRVVYVVTGLAVALPAVASWISDPCSERWACWTEVPCSELVGGGLCAASGACRQTPRNVALARQHHHVMRHDITGAARRARRSVVTVASCTDHRHVRPG